MKMVSAHNDAHRVQLGDLAPVGLIARPSHWRKAQSVNATLQPAFGVDLRQFLQLTW